jgi:hypothetical protein
VQILLEVAGIYSDHDTTFYKPFGSIGAEKGFLYGRTVQKKVPTNAIMAAPHANADFLLFLRKVIFGNYSAHFANKESFKNYVELKVKFPPKLDVASGYETATLNTTGPEAMRGSLAKWIQTTLGRDHDFDKEMKIMEKCRFPEGVLQANSAKAWLM